VLNNIFRFISRHKLSIAVVGLLLTFGILGEQTKLVLSGQIAKVPTSNLIVQDHQDSSGTTLLSQLREVRTQ